MKKIVIVLTILIFTLFVTSCGGSGKKDDKEADNTEISDSDETDDSDAADPTDSGNGETDNDPSDTSDSGDSTDSGDSADSGDSTDSGDHSDSGDDSGEWDITDSGEYPLPDDMTLEELEKACKNKETVNEVAYDCSVKECQRFTFCNGGGKIGENTIAKCRDGEDSDGDGYADCKDPECQVYRFCNQTAEDKACLEILDSTNDHAAACAEDACKNFAGCADNGVNICNLSEDPYKYEKGTCECGWSRSKMLEDLNNNPDAEDEKFCAFNLDNQNIMQFVSPSDEAENNLLPRKVILKTDINLEQQNQWEMLNGDTKQASKQFQGDFDGNGKRIRGNLTCSKNEHSCGLFASLLTATVKNLKLDFTIKGPEQTGAIAGSSSNSTIGDIKSAAKVYAENVSGYGHDNYSAVAGGIVGSDNNSNFENLTVSGSVSATSKMADSAALAGGVVGLGISTKITKAKSSASVTSSFNGTKYQASVFKSCAGGIVGFITDTYPRLDEVEVNASIQATSQVDKTVTAAGGIAGCVSDIITVSGADEFVLIANNSYPDKKIMEVTISSAKSSGTVKAENTSTASDVSYSSHNEFAGGIVGVIRSQNEGNVVTGAYSESNIECHSSPGNYTACTTGGIVGYARNKTILRSVSYKGKIETLSGKNSRVGGIAGYATNNSQIANASASGSITVKDGDNENLNVYAGGIVGYAYEDASFINTYNNIVIKKQFASEKASFKAGAVAGYGGSDTRFYESYWNPLTLPDEDDAQIVGEYKTGIQIDTTCHKYEKSGGHRIETIPDNESPELFDRLRYNIGVYLPAEEIFGVASPNLPYAEDYRTWKTYTDSDGVLWPVIDLESDERFKGGSN